MITHENTLSERERYILTALAADGDSTTVRRATALLDWSRGESREKIAQATGMRTTQVQYLTRNFAQKRLEVFSPSSVERASRGLSGCISVEDLLKRNPTDLPHARYVCSLALQLFDGTPSVHRLGQNWRRILETGALLHNIGASEHEDRHHQAGRNIILAHDLEGMSTTDRDIISCLILFQRKKPRASKDPIFTSLDQAARKSTLALAAILRVADALDDSQSGSTRVASIHVNAVTDLVVEGPSALSDAVKANKRADLWREVLSPPVIIRLSGQALPEQNAPVRPRLRTDVRALEPVTRAGRKIMSAQFAKIHSLEDSVRAGDDIAAVHDMRVSTRRLRSAFRLLGKYFPKKTMRRLSKPLRQLAGILGQVRDLDVMIENLRTFSATLTIERQRALDPLLADWQARRAQAHRTLVDLLDSSDYDEWVARMEDLIEGKDPRQSPRVADVVPGLIWKLYGRLRQYERRVKQPTLTDLHALRIEGKRLRYALEFFAEASGGKTALLLEPLIALQDHLGELHDADMATQLIAEFIASRARHAQRQGLASTDFESVAGYLNALRNTRSELEATFPERWQIIVKPAWRQALSDSVASL